MLKPLPVIIFCLLTNPGNANESKTLASLIENRSCVECNLSNQQPTSINEYFHVKDTKQTTVAFDKNGVCAACNFNKN